MLAVTACSCDIAVPGEPAAGRLAADAGAVIDLRARGRLESD